MGAKRELIFHTRDRNLVQKQIFLNNFVQDCSLQHTSLILDINVDTCQNKVSTDQYHMTISRAQVRPYRGQLFFFKLTADPGLVVDCIAGSSQVRHSHSHLNEA